jgi:hypothetical protein
MRGVKPWKSSDQEGTVKMKILRLLMLGIVAAGLAGTVSADSLELKNGQIIQGKFLGASATSIRFQVNGQEQVFAASDVLNISFSDTTVQDTSAAAPAPAPAATGGATAPGSAAPAAQQGTEQPQTITIPAGTSIVIRMIDGVDSKKNKIGDTFTASLDSPLMVGSMEVAAKGADVFGKLAEAKEAGKISGGAELTLELTGIRIAGNIVPIDSTTYDAVGKGRGKQSAARIGGGAVLGAIIGGVAGGGAGAAIGAGAGAAAGTAVQLVTHGEVIRIPSETLLEFKLQNDVSVPTPGAAN